MKYFSYILSIYIIALIAIPCIDEPVDHSDCKIEFSHETYDTQQAADHCSPFCTCYCCTSPVLYHYYDIRTDFFALKYHLKFNTGYTSSIYTAIWQPPKVS